MDQKRLLLRQRQRKQVLFPVREGPLLSQCKLDPDHCLPSGMVATMNAFLGSPEDWVIKEIKEIKPE